MPSPITEEAIRIIEAAPEHGPLQPIEYANALPPQAGVLARLLHDEEIAKAAGTYRDADLLAGTAQTWFRRLGAGAAYSGFFAAVLGGVGLYLGSGPSQETLQSNLGLAQLFFLALSLLCAFLLYVFKPFRTWRTQRGSAEASRLRVFALMMNGRSVVQDGELPLLPLQLECFRRHLVDGQRRFFARRGPQQRRLVVVWKILGGVAILLVLAAGLPQLLRLKQLGLLPESLVNQIERVPWGEKASVLVGLLGGSLQSLLAALIVISPVQRNAEKYEAMLKELDKYASEPLDAVRAAAVSGDSASVRGFAKAISDDLAEEGKEWRLLHQVLSEMALTQLASQRKS